MIIHCKSCKNKFTVLADEINLEGRILQCKHCNDQWIYESKTKYLENRLLELGDDLNKTEIKLNIKKDEHIDKIKNLENDLQIKITELENQKKLEEKVLAFEERLVNTEKTNSEQKDLEIKISSIENQIKLTHEDIFSKNKDIEKKTNYIETKINSYEKVDIIQDYEELNKVEVNNRDVVNIRPLDLVNKKSKKQSHENKKKFSFFRPDKIK